MNIKFVSLKFISLDWFWRCKKSKRNWKLWWWTV